MSMEKINVQLYGGGNTPCEADTIWCDHFNECTLYAENKCLQCRSLGGGRCKYGSRNTTKGYTSRSKKYSSFMYKYKSDEVYGKLNYPLSQTVALIGEYVWLNLKNVVIKKKESEDYIAENNVGLFARASWVEKDKLTVELLNKAFSCVPRTFFGNSEIETYKTEVLPDIIMGLKTHLPELYKSLVTQYPEYDLEPNYIGKDAYISTMVEGSELKDYNGNKFILKNGKLICKHYHSAFIPFNGEGAKIEFEVNSKATYKITDNGQCDKNTKFK